MLGFDGKGDDDQDDKGDQGDDDQGDQDDKGDDDEEEGGRALRTVTPGSS